MSSTKNTWNEKKFLSNSFIFFGKHSELNERLDMLCISIKLSEIFFVNLLNFHLNMSCKMCSGSLFLFY